MNGNSYRPYRSTGITTAVKYLLIINIVIWLSTYVLYSYASFNLAQYLALYNFQSPNFGIWQFLTYGFMHAFINSDGSLEIFHIAGNMFGLYFFGSHLERFWGTKRFLLFYFIALLGSVVLYWSYSNYKEHKIVAETKKVIEEITPFEFYNFISKDERLDKTLGHETLTKFYQDWKAHPDDPAYVAEATNYLKLLLDVQQRQSSIMGASGAIFAILLAFGMLFPNTLITPLFGFPIKAKYFVLLYGTIEFYSTLANVPGDNVAHVAHLAGMLVAFVLVRLWHGKKY